MAQLDAIGSVRGAASGKARAGAFDGVEQKHALKKRREVLASHAELGQQRVERALPARHGMMDGIEARDDDVVVALEADCLGARQDYGIFRVA